MNLLRLPFLPLGGLLVTLALPLPQAPAQAPTPSRPTTHPSPIKGWQPEVYESFFVSQGDGTLQPTLCYFPKPDKPAPLLVALHTWGGDYLQAEPAYSAWCIKKGWAFVHPHFRGANKKPEACGSELVVADLLSVVEWARQMGPIDSDRIYLIGNSGGGYASMLLAGRAPKLWAAVSQWCGIYDLRDWHAQRSKDAYGQMLEAVCGGAPGSSPEVDEQFRKRSASTWLKAASELPIDLNTGIHDGHKGSVPVSHSLKAFNALVRAEDQLPADLIEGMTRSAQVPAHLKFQDTDPLYANRPVLFRKTSSNTRITVFEGGHESVTTAGLAWLEQQRRGKPAVWNIPTPAEIGPAAEVGR